jgi:hypothetical protein
VSSFLSLLMSFGPRPRKGIRRPWRETIRLTGPYSTGLLKATIHGSGMETSIVHHAIWGMRVIRSGKLDTTII